MSLGVSLRAPHYGWDEQWYVRDYMWERTLCQTVITDIEQWRVYNRELHHHEYETLIIKSVWQPMDRPCLLWELQVQGRNTNPRPIAARPLIITYIQRPTLHAVTVAPKWSVSRSVPMCCCVTVWLRCSSCVDSGLSASSLIYPVVTAVDDSGGSVSAAVMMWTAPSTEASTVASTCQLAGEVPAEVSTAVSTWRPGSVCCLAGDVSAIVSTAVSARLLSSVIMSMPEVNMSTPVIVSTLDVNVSTSRVACQQLIIWCQRVNTWCHRVNAWCQRLVSTCQHLVSTQVCCLGGSMCALMLLVWQCPVYAIPS